MERPRWTLSRATLAGALVALASLTLVACGGDDDAGDDASAQEGNGNGSGGGEVVFAVPDGYEGPEQGVPTEYEEPESCEGRTVGFQNPLRANESLDALERAATATVEDLGGEVIALDDGLDPDAQVSNMQQLIAQEVESTGFFPIDPEATDPVIEQADDAGVPVVAVERDSDPEGDLGLISTQILEGRDMQAFNQATVLSEARPGAQIAIVGLAVPVPSLVYWAERAEHWAEEMGLEVVDTDVNQTDDAAGGEQVGNALVTSNPDLEGVIAYNDPTALGIAVAARGAGMDLDIVGLNGGEDGLDGVRSGRITATVQIDAVGTGVQMGRALCTLANDPDAEVPNSVVDPPTNPITEENIDAATTWSDQVEELGNG